ncbi:heme A synthase [Massilia sp. CF038]|uniref:COX15/CtaA family protein n=1 Tax=Massilia sp. CF038 TaxID=1881045 RepID=UPI000917C5A5|nr:COX15/CtaA family protein [Massilia sp. CF038]SHH26327.1 cytochrome c oxidase assembly protein subunit 15 [Massilia sp. CF038]
MQLPHFVQLAITGLLAASVPLAMVWMSSDPNKFRKLVWLTAFLTFDLIVFGAFTRLTDSGLGCPDWPGCYGMANPFLAHEQIVAAEALLPSGPVTVVKAWIEMIHRYLAMGVGCLCVALTATAWIQWRKKRAAEFRPGLPTATLLAVCVQGAFGAWTVTLKLQPVIVTIHLLLAMCLLAMLCWLGARQDAVLAPPKAPVQVKGLRMLARWAALILFIQIALGGWVSTNYATLACTGFPLCNGEMIPALDFEHGFTLWRELGKTAAGHYLPFSALTSIHWVHRNFAYIVLLVLGLTAWRAWTVPGLDKHARRIAIVLGVQACTGIATVYFNFPLAIAVLHNAGAALLVVLVTMLNYQTKTRFSAPAPARPEQ